MSDVAIGGGQPLRDLVPGGQPLPDAGAAAEAGIVGRRSVVRRLLRQRSAVVGLVLLGFLLLVALLADVLATHDPIQVLLGVEPGMRPRTPPCIHLLGCAPDQAQHILGSDGNGRDEYSRLLFGTRVSLFVGFVTVFGAILIGTVIGAVAGYAEIGRAHV